jgi:3-isopropylmalate dehydrogenase
MTKRLLLLPGDGIGQEVCAEAAKVTRWLAKNAGLDVEIQEFPFGGTSYDLCGEPLSPEAKAAAFKSDAVLMGAVGGPKWDDVPRDKRPEAGLLTLRAEMDVYANLRPAFCFEPLIDASTLKREVVAGLDLIIVRELTSGTYFKQPKGITQLPDGSEVGVDTQEYTTAEIERVARAAFKLAKARRNKVHSVEKANVMMSGVLWRKVVTRLHKAEFPEVELHHMYADNCAMQLVRNPKQFDVIVTDNLFGDVLSDCAAMLTGSLGMLPSAALGDAGKPGLYEPVHGSAPDIAGKGFANPLACILSLQMALEWSLGRRDLADRLWQAVTKALENGARTRDIGGKLSTSEMGDAVIKYLA